jgi:beta-glucanase (GH16 family)
LSTKGLHSWQYGRFEMRAKIDCRSGLWPAFWTLGENGDWPHNGEVDVMEYYQKTILANFAWGSNEKWKPIWNDFKLPIDPLIISDPEWTQEFHTWKMDWDKDCIEIFLDDKMLNSVELSNTFNKDQEGKNPFMQPHYIIINMAVGGTQGGNPLQTEFPARYIIDYVRVYQK